MLRPRDLVLFYRVVRRSLRRRSAQARWDRYSKIRYPLPRGRFQAAVYFADGMVNHYQLRQWYEPLVRLAETHPVVIITRNVRTAIRLKDISPLPVVCLPYIADVESWMAEQPVGAVFYLNQNARNFQMMRLREPAHVFLSHGESDKDYMASNQLKAYDYTFIAGQAAHERIASRLKNYNVVERTFQVGRPQVDVEHDPPFALPEDDRKVVFYAPTWEGDRPTMTYSSLLSHGPTMVKSLLATGTHRVIYRPHPRTGITDKRYLDAHDEIVKALESANKAEPEAGHVVDSDSMFGWHLAAADECIADISAVAFDWLATGKPLVLTEPDNDEAEIDRQGIAGTLPMLAKDQAASIVSVLSESQDAASRTTRAALVERYFGDVTPGKSMERWLDTAKTVILERQPATSSGPDGPVRLSDKSDGAVGSPGSASPH